MGKKDNDPFDELSRRERQIMDVVYRLEEATTSEVMAGIPDPPSINAVRRLMAILEEKGHLQHEWRGPRHVFFPTVPRNTAAKHALERVRKTFFGGSAVHAMAALFDQSNDLSKDDLEMLSQMIDQAKKEGR
ncbi:MAG: BlaI/MecI/CopY family transcriptional regulator [Acidobacteriota bacterium]|nr:BlaI/MecI/CopY family transcriptional regulator [Acidobacteriota bacterium]